MSKLKRPLYIVSIVVIILTILVLFNAAASHVASGGKKLGPLTRPIAFLSELPKTIHAVLTSSELKGIPPTFIDRDDSFEASNSLDYDVYGLNAFDNSRNGSWEVRLFNFRNDSIIHKWYVTKEMYDSEERQFANTPPLNCIMLPNRELIVPINNLFKLDANSKVIWREPSRSVHHAINVDHDGNIWACTAGKRGVYDYVLKNTFLFRDDHITLFDAADGYVLYDKSVSQILIDNGYKSFVYGTTDLGPEMGQGGDPIHLNDIQPALKDGVYWKKGDLFLSLRHKSLVVLYRPSTNKILRLIHGPFLFQHDVDIISDQQVAIFNNNLPVRYHEEPYDDIQDSPDMVSDTLYLSEIILYNFKDSTFTFHLRHQFEKERIYTESEGFFEIMSNGDTYVESQNDGKLYIMNDKELLFKKQLPTPMPKKVALPNWIRIYENINF